MTEGGGGRSWMQEVGGLGGGMRGVRRVRSFVGRGDGDMAE